MASISTEAIFRYTQSKDSGDLKCSSKGRREKQKTSHFILPLQFQNNSELNKTGKNPLKPSTFRYNYMEILWLVHSKKYKLGSRWQLLSSNPHTLLLREQVQHTFTLDRFLLELLILFGKISHTTCRGRNFSQSKSKTDNSTLTANEWE